MTELNDRIDILRHLGELREEHYQSADEEGFVLCQRCGRKVSTKYSEEVIEHEAEHFD